MRVNAVAARTARCSCSVCVFCTHNQPTRLVHAAAGRQQCMHRDCFATLLLLSCVLLRPQSHLLSGSAAAGLRHGWWMAAASLTPASEHRAGTCLPASCCCIGCWMGRCSCCCRCVRRYCCWLLLLTAGAAWERTRQQNERACYSARWLWAETRWLHAHTGHTHALFAETAAS